MHNVLASDAFTLAKKQPQISIYGHKIETEMQALMIESCFAKNMNYEQLLKGCCLETIQLYLSEIKLHTTKHATISFCA